MAASARRLRIILLGLAVALGGIVVSPAGLGVGSKAQAQEKKRGFNLFAPLFRRTDKPQQSVGKKRQHREIKVRRSKRKAAPRRSTRQSNTRQKRIVRTGRAAARTETARRVVSQAPKDPDARVILVIGDFIASGLSRGLRDSYAENPTITVIDRSMPSSGIVRDDHYDWVGEAKRFLAEEKRIDVVVAVVGSNDSQPFRAGGRPSITFRSDEWVATYRQRAAELMKTFNDAGKPVVWLSVPPMQRQSLSTNIAFLNDIQEQAAADAPGVTYLDIWNGFADENGRYISTGPDEKGQVRRLRTSDGINLSGAGRSKIAFYAQQEIDKIVGGSVAAFAALTVTPEAIATPSEVPVRPSVWEMVLTGETEPKTSVTLAGVKPDVPDLKPGKKGDRDAELVLKLLRDGLPPDARPGRVDAITSGEQLGVPAL